MNIRSWGKYSTEFIESILDRLESWEWVMDIARSEWITHSTISTWKAKYWTEAPADVWLDNLSSYFQDEEPEIREWTEWKVYIFHVTESVAWVDTSREIPVRMDTVEAIIADYVNMWANLTGQQVVNKYGLTGKAWNAIRSQLNVTKFSDVLPNESFEWKSDEESEQLIARTVQKGMLDKRKRMYERQSERAKDTLYKNVLRRQDNADIFGEKVAEALWSYKPTPTPHKINKIGKSDIAQFIISDMHFWKQGTDRIISDIDKIVQEMIDCPESHIDIFCLWDLAENLTQNGMHWDTVMNLDPEWRNPFKAMMKIVDIMVSRIKLVSESKDVAFYWAVWNHDRLSKNNQEDEMRMWAMIIYEFMRRELEWKVAFHFSDESVFVVETENICYIIGHGDRNFFKKKTKDIVFTYWNNKKRNVIMHGHIHDAKIDTEMNTIRVYAPALAWPGSYDTRLWLKSNTGYVTLRIKDGLPSAEFNPLD